MPTGDAVPTAEAAPGAPPAPPVPPGAARLPPSGATAIGEDPRRGGAHRPAEIRLPPPAHVEPDLGGPASRATSSARSDHSEPALHEHQDARISAHCPPSHCCIAPEQSPARSDETNCLRILPWPREGPIGVQPAETGSPLTWTPVLELPPIMFIMLSYGRISEAVTRLDTATPLLRSARPRRRKKGPPVTGSCSVGTDLRGLRSPDRRRQFAQTDARNAGG